MRKSWDGFWALRWRWKGPLLAFAAIVVLAAVAGEPPDEEIETNDPASVDRTASASATPERDSSDRDDEPGTSPTATPTGATNTDDRPSAGARGGGGLTTTPTTEVRTRAPPASGELTATFIDVGQGDATLLQAPGATMLIDAGRHDRSDLVPALRALGVEDIDVVVITHGHADHVGQLDRVLAAFPVGEVWMSGTPHTTQTFDRALRAIEDSSTLYEEPRAGDSTTVGPLLLDVLNPERLDGDLHHDSLSVRVTYGAVAFVFTGDAEAETEAVMLARGAEMLRADVLQLGHHGSGTSTTAAFLQAVSPAIAVYSAGASNSYGHPHEEVVARVLGAGAELYGTDVHGTIAVRTDGALLSVATARGAPAIASAGPATPDPGGTPDATPARTATPAPTAAPSLAGCEPGQVDINAAGLDELQRVHQIGPARAQQIIDLRPFASVDSMTRISGIGPVLIEQIKAQGVACVQ